MNEAITVHKLYGGEVTLVYDDDHHRYTEDTIDGPVVQGVSSALGSISKPLHLWTLKVGLNFVREKLTAGTELTVDQLEAVLESARKAHFRQKNDAADRGTSVHKYVELTIKGVDFEEPEEGVILDKLNAFRQFISDHSPSFIDSERVVYSRKYKYCGTLDLTLVLNGKRYVGDIKTGTAVRDTYWAQTAAYQQALEEETGETFDGGRCIILLSTDPKTGMSDYSIHFRDNSYFKEDFTAFMCGKYLAGWLDAKAWDKDDLITIENILGL